MARRLSTRERATRPAAAAKPVRRTGAAVAHSARASRPAIARALQRRAGNRALGALLTQHTAAAPRGAGAREIASLAASRSAATRRQAAAPRIQRVLSPTSPVDANDVTNVERLGNEQLVFRVSGQGGDSVILKIEIGSNEPVEQYRGREREIYRLGRMVLENVPQTRPVTPADLVQIQAIPDNVGDAPAMKQLFTDVINSGLPAVFVKAESMDVGINLGDLVKGGRQDRTRGEHNRLKQLLYSKSKMRALGRMAAFDLLIGNRDRFRNDMTVNVENVDFTAGRAVLPLDNLDPTSPITPGQWGEQAHLASAASLRAYAADTVNYMYGLAGKDDTHRNWGRSARAFRAGMIAALADMRAQLPHVQHRAGYGGARGEIAGELARRIGLTFAG